LALQAAQVGSVFQQPASPVQCVPGHIPIAAFIPSAPLSKAFSPGRGLQIGQTNIPASLALQSPHPVRRSVRQFVARYGSRGGQQPEVMDFPPFLSRRLDEKKLIFYPVYQHFVLHGFPPLLLPAVLL
jgi:hypothetical protein